MRSSAAIGLAAVIGLAGGAAFAGIQLKKVVGTLDVEGHWVEIRDGRGETAGKLAIPGKGWRLGAPYVMTPRGEYLSRDPAGKDEAVRVQKERGAAAEWGFELVDKETPRGAGGGLVRGASSQRFRLKVPEGPFRDWYIGRGPPLESNALGNARRPLTLVREVKDAAVFQHVEAVYDTDHK